MNHNIKVLFITYSSGLYGDNKALLNIIDGFIEYGIQIKVIIGSEGKICSELKNRNIDYLIIKSYFSIYPPLKSIKDLYLFLPRLLRTILFNCIAVLKIDKFSKIYKPDIIHTNVGPVHIGYSVAKKNKIPHVWHIREYQDLDFEMYPMFSKTSFKNKLNSKYNYPIAITRGIYSYFGMNSNAKVIYDGVLKSENIQFKPVKQKYFLFVGRLESAKGIDFLLDTYIEFCKENIDYELYLAGDGTADHLSKLQSRVTDLQLNDRVKFLGFRSDISDLMANATALIVPSRFEGFGFITVEAMFNGCLVIGNNTAGTKEILEKENLGLLYTGKDELLKKMKCVVENGIESFYPMIMTAQSQALKLYSQELNVDSVYNFYKELIDNA